MIKLYSETLTHYASSLVTSIARYGYLTFLDNSTCLQKSMETAERSKEIGFTAAADVVAHLLLDVVGALNAHVDYFYHPKIVIPYIPTEKYQTWVNSGNTDCFRLEELYDAHIRTLHPDPLLESAIKWFTTRFYSEILNLYSGAGFDDVYHPIYTTLESIRTGLVNQNSQLIILEPTDYQFIADGSDVEEIKKPLSATAYGFLKQGDCNILFEHAARYILSPDDQDSDEDPTVELYALTPKTVAAIQKL